LHNKRSSTWLPGKVDSAKVRQARRPRAPRQQALCPEWQMDIRICLECGGVALISVRRAAAAAGEVVAVAAVHEAAPRERRP